MRKRIEKRDTLFKNSESVVCETTIILAMSLGLIFSDQS
jgi:hypothetical protein